MSNLEGKSKDEFEESGQDVDRVEGSSFTDPQSSKQESSAARMMPSDEDETLAPEGPDRVRSESTALPKTSTQGGGPRTLRGKQRSCYNAIKHGIFSQAVLLKRESRPQFIRLLRGFQEYFGPEGTLENLLVEKLTVLAWRMRRCLCAENGEIQAGPLSSKTARPVPIIVEYEGQQERQGIMELFELPEFPRLELCLELLQEPATSIRNNGFDEAQDSRILKKLYRAPVDGAKKQNLYGTYRAARLMASASEQERREKAYPSPEQCRSNLVKEIDRQIIRVKSGLHAKEELEELERIRYNVPDRERQERLIRYETTLEKAFDRTLAQLERLQHARGIKQGPAKPALPSVEGT